MEENKNQPGIQKRQKLLIGVIAIIGLAAFTFSIFQITGTIGKPFKPAKNPKSELVLINIEPTEQETLNDLKNKDTDQDGLSDYEELYVFETSPYVKDSDSDGKTDNEEINAGTDPNCAPDKPCAGNINNTNTAVTNTNTNNALATSGTVSAQALRENLKSQGVPSNILDSMDDQTLQEVYQQTIDETGAAGITTNGNVNEPLVSGSEITLQSLQSLNASQIRNLLIQSGVKAEELQQVDDATLEAIYQQTLNEQMGQPSVATNTNSANVNAGNVNK